MLALNLYKDVGTNLLFPSFIYWVKLACFLVIVITGINMQLPFPKSVFQVRHRLRRDHGIDGGIPVVFSLEKPKAKLLPFKGPSGEEENPSDYQVQMFYLLV